MRIEHFALQVQDPVAMAEWYERHLGCSVARAGGAPSNARFLLDGAGSVMLEIYRNPRLCPPDYMSMDPLVMHVAWISRDPGADRDRLVKAGATVVEDLNTSPAGDELVMLRDPWGVPAQLVKRAKPMVPES